MAILHNEYSDVSEGIRKELDDGAIGLILDNVQKYQYRYPFKSSIREVVSNGLDSHRERDMALKILAGELDPAEVFEDLGDHPVYKDSKFDPTYYDPKWLSDETSITVKYYEGPVRDRVVITDYGVGLRETDRLPGFMKIGYSTKRLNKLVLGRYGIGAKAPLSTMIPFFTIRNYYNGYEYAFNIYSATVESIIPEKSLVGATVVSNVPFNLRANGQDILCYKKDATRKNGMEVEFEVKKHNKGQIVEAVKSQLMYYPEVKFYIVNQQGQEVFEETSAEVLIRNEKFIVSEQNYYRQPHVVIAGMNYGLIDFDELEIDRKNGALGIQVKQEEIDIGPSRESVIWTDRTREVMLKALDDVTKLAQEIVEKELSTDDLFEWIDKAMSIASYTFSGQSVMAKVLGALRYLIDQEKLSPTFRVEGVPLDLKQILFMFGRVETKRNGRGQIERGGTPHFSSGNIYYDPDGRANNRIDAHLVKTHGTFIRLVPNYTLEPGVTGEPTWFLRTGELAEMRSKLKIPDLSPQQREKIAAVYEYLAKRFPIYKDVEVPESDEPEKEVEVVDVEAEAAKQAAIRQQALQQAIADRDSLLQSGKAIHAKFDTGRCLLHTDALKVINTNEVYYGNAVDGTLVEFAMHIARPGAKAYGAMLNTEDKLTLDGTSWYQNDMKTNGLFSTNGPFYFLPSHFLTPKRNGAFSVTEPPYTAILEVAQSVNKHMKGFYHINEFFERVERNTLTMSKALINWNTARKVKEILEPYWKIDSELLVALPHLSKRVDVLKQFTNRFHSASIQNTALHEELTGHLDRLITLQEFMHDSPDADPAMIKEMISEVTAENVSALHCIHMELYKEALELRQVLQQIQLLSFIKMKYVKEDDYNNKLVMLVDDFLTTKGMRDIDYKDLSSYLNLF